jgi:Outer membrane protein beta-barrel domain
VTTTGGRRSAPWKREAIMMCRLVTLGITLMLLAMPVAAAAQSPAPIEDALPPAWEISLDGQVGVPRGYLKVGEFNTPGTRLRLHDDLGIDMSEAVEAGLGYHLTSRDMLRVSFLYYFLRGSTTTPSPVTYNGEAFPAGHLDSNADFYRISLAYERGLFTTDNGLRLSGDVGLSYVYLNPKVNQNAEDFYLQELPIPVLGLRVNAPLGRRLSLTAFVEGGGLPRVNSGRKEGGTVFLEQHHADAGLGLTYMLTSSLQLHADYRFTYFFQHETSHEDDNAFQLIDNGFRMGVNFRF